MCKTERFRMRLAWLWTLLAASFILVSAVLSYSSDINEINAAIQSKGARWVARETPFTHLSPEEMKRMCGAREPEPSEDVGTEASSYIPLALPSSFDWAQNGGNFVTSVKEQGGICGSCWAFSSTAALESKTLITFNMPGIDLDLSEQIVVSCTGGQSNCQGGSVKEAADFLQNYGTGLDRCYPYIGGDGNCGQACANWQENAYKMDRWWYVNRGKAADLSAIKNALFTDGPLPAWIKVYQDFSSYGHGVYSYTTGDFRANHFVLIVGWDDSLNAFRCKNSWGTDWGESGFFWIDYDELYGVGTTEFGKWAYAFGDVLHNAPTSGPDLAGEWLSLEKSCKTSSKGQQCKITGSLKVTNIGDQDASSFYVDISYSGNLLKRIRVPKLKAGASKTLKTNCNLPAGETGGEVIASIDADDTVVEPDETNNIEIHGIPE